MAKVLNISSRNNFSVAASTTNYYYISPQFLNGGDTVESTINTKVRSAGVHSLLYMNILSNNRGASTFRFRKNSANGNMVLSVGASTTGEFEDVINTDSVVAGDDVCYQVVTGAGGTNFTFQIVSTLFRPNVGTVVSHASAPGGFSTASTTVYSSIGSQSQWNATEADRQWKSKAAGTLRNFFTYIGVNARTTSSTIGNRVAGANGSMSVSIPASTTGAFEDTTNTDTVSVNNMLGFYLTTGTGTGGINSGNVRMEFFNYTNQFQFISCPASTSTVNASVTTYFPMAGRTEQETTESEIKTDANIPMRISNLQCYLNANTVSATSTLRLRKNTANGNNAVSITASTTGWFEDTTNIDEIASTDEINYQLVTGGTGTSMALTTIGCLAYSKVPRFFFGS
jgi:hypothetical protein